MGVEDLEVGCILDSGIHSITSSVASPAMDPKARACAGPRREWTGPSPAVVLSPSLNSHATL